MLTDEQVIACLSHTGGRVAMLNAAYRMGMLRAAEMCEAEFPRYYGGNMANFRQCAEAIRAEAGETSEPRKGE